MPKRYAVTLDDGTVRDVGKYIVAKDGKALSVVRALVACMAPRLTKCSGTIPR
jgi:hypothetical protein